MAIAQAQKKVQPQKRLRQKQKRKRQRNRQQRNLRKRDHPSESLEAKILPPLFLSQRKMPLSMEGNKKAVFAQWSLLATQHGEQQCFLSNYMSSQATTDINEVYPAIVWPCKLPMVKWPATVSHQQQSALTTHLCEDDQQQYVFSSVIPLPVIYGKLGNNVTTKDLQYEVNEMISRQLIPYLFASDLSTSPY